MYHLNCPSCRAKRESPFVRVGAATRCPSCGHTWRISGSHIRRVTRAMTEPALDEEPPSEDARAGSSVTGMSGLSDLMQAEPNAKAGDTAVGGQPPPIREAKFASVEAAQNLAQSAANLRQTQKPGSMSPQTRRMAILVIALLALGVALAGIGLVLLGGDDANTNRSVASPVGSADESKSPEDLPLDPAGPPSEPVVDEPGAFINERTAPRLRTKHALTASRAIGCFEMNPLPLNQGGAA